MNRVVGTETVLDFERIDYLNARAAKLDAQYSIIQAKVNMLDVMTPLSATQQEDPILKATFDRETRKQKNLEEEEKRLKCAYNDVMAMLSPPPTKTVTERLISPDEGSDDDIPPIEPEQPAHSPVGEPDTKTHYDTSIVQDAASLDENLTFNDFNDSLNDILQDNDIKIPSQNVDLFESITTSINQIGDQFTDVTAAFAGQSTGVTAQTLVSSNDNVPYQEKFDLTTQDDPKGIINTANENKDEIFNIISPSTVLNQLNRPKQARFTLN